jgi:hypothetical protein
MDPKYFKIPIRIIATFMMMILLSGAFPVMAASGNIFSASLQSINNSRVTFTKIDLYANIETIGVVVSGASLPKTAELMYRQDGETVWHTGHPLMRIDDGRLVGSLFGLSPSTSYNIKVLDGSTEISDSSVTQPKELQFTPSIVLHVNDDAPAGGDGSAAAPFQTIQEGVNHATPGTQVLVADGIYHEAVTFPASGNPGNWVQVKAEGGGAILEGSENLSGNIWAPHPSKAKVWSTKIGTSIAYLARDQKRFYMYDDLTSLLEGRGHNNIAMNEGGYIDAGRLYVRSLDNPANHTWQVPRFDQAFSADGRDWLWIEGFETRLYWCGVCTKNVSHLVIRNNRIHNIQLGIYFNWTGGDAQGNDTRIEFNDISDPQVNDWPWKAVKGTTMEGTAIVVRGHIGAIVHDNEIHHFFNGIYTGSSAALENFELALDADIYNNRIHHIGDDALEPEGACVNHRFRNNTIDRVFVGISLAPVTQGPTWVLRSTFTNYSGRAVKWDRNSDGVVLIYHNTSWTDAPGVNAIDLISPVYNAVMRNNIFQTTGYVIEEVPTGSTGHDWNNDNLYTTRTATEPHFKWNNVSYDTIAKFCAASGLECNGYETPPGLTNPNGGDFTLLSSSSNIDRGIVITGINDQFSGSAPDAGVFEFASDTPPAVLSIVRADANPTGATSVNFTVTLSEPVTGVDTLAPFNDFGLVTSPTITGASITSVSPVSDTTYTIGVNTGSGNGIIRLDLIDDDSIVDGASNPLGGAGTGNGNFNTGESYTVEKNLLTVMGSLPADPNPTGADNLHFTVNFSKEVSGVDAGDFVTFTTGGISGATIGDVTGSGSSYTVTVATGTGDGTLRLDIIDNDSILDATANPLGGVGAGNGNFTAGGTYTIDKTAPAMISSIRIDPNPTTAENVRFAVTFSESVSGVDTTDFMLTTTDGLSAASISSLSGSANTYTVTVASGTGIGNLRLDLVDNDSILDPSGKPLGGAGAGNGNFTIGEAYTVNKPPVTILSEVFRSTGANDGWILESSEDSNIGGVKDSNATTILLGDDVRNRQYRSILHFPTSNLPDNAVITQVILMIKKQGVIGTDPFNTLQNISIDIRKGVFGSFGPFRIGALQVSDFQAPADKNSVGVIQNNPAGSWYWAMLDNTAHPFINLTGVTQLRLGFQIDDNNNRVNDYLKFFSGNAGLVGDRPQLLIKYYIPKKQTTTPAPGSTGTPVAIPSTPAVNPNLKWNVGNQGIKWAEVSFDSIAPRGMIMKQCWNAMGMDDQGRIYIGFTSTRADRREDFAVYRYDPRSGEKVFLGTFLDVTAAAGNTQNGENIPKGHTRMISANGQMYMGSQSFHDLKREIDSLPIFRGSHLFAFDTVAGLFKDLSATLPGGVVTEHEGMISLNILPAEHLLVGLAHPSSDIILYDYLTEQLVKVVPGIPWTLGNPLSREVIVAPSGNIFTYRGTEDVVQRNEFHPVWVYNIHSGEMRESGFQMTNGFWVGQTQKRDGSKIYINTVAGRIYEFNVATETFRDLGYELPITDNRMIDYTYTITLSPDEKKLYYILSIIQKAGGTPGSGRVQSGELYYYDIASGQVVFVQQLPVGIYTSADLRDSQNIYFAHFGNSTNIWSGEPKLFILQVPS